jgi:hypothetical protein
MLEIDQLEMKGKIDGILNRWPAAANCLRAFRLMPAKASWRPATVWHLLTDTAGESEWLHPSRMINIGWFAETLPLEEHLPTLAECCQRRRCARERT